MWRRQRAPTRAEQLHFAGVDDRDVYNITAPFLDRGRWVIAGRVERRESEHSETYFFVQSGDRWEPLREAPVLPLQDPFVTRIADELVFGGVETFIHPRGTPPRFLWWRTILFRGRDVGDLRPFFVGPDGMKDIRLVELADGTVGVFTRPQGKKGGRGKIGFTRVASLEALTLEAIEEAPLLEGMFLDDEWGGVNAAYLLPDGTLGVLGHIACFDPDGRRNYYALVFRFDPETRRYWDVRVIAERENFLPGPAKRDDLTNVVFPGGLVRRPDGWAELYAGVSDVGAQKLILPDPFAAPASSSAGDGPDRRSMAGGVREAGMQVMHSQVTHSEEGR
ncbi:DUF1861 family protein [Hydrogenibacillus sp. N12]|uniref:DUF1861 family protein n=1 Tax=Hydrogenibacillus sp. N12 TaxID=2866627 RepID=UPI001C7DF8A3|nr:DUF1861 family protein [Hydrogenibacillus sp. N12]QZA34176.1 DUF1861 family protein [Hydrogenibacillus sp. N12]